MFGLRAQFRGAAALLAVAALTTGLAACSGHGAPTPTGISEPIPTLPGTPGHYDDGEFSFDYPADWPVLSAFQSWPNPTFFVVAVLGTGAWSENCQHGTDSQGDWMTCGADMVTVPPDGIVVKIYWRAGGPAPICWSPAPTANATVGSSAVLKTVDGDVTTWEFRWPDGQFFWPNDPTFEVHTSDPAQLAKAEAMVASFRWGANAPTSAGLCSPALAS
jgi:hypothetical protein